MIKYPETSSNSLHCDETVVIHLRLDDFHRNGIDSEIIDFNYYDDIIKQFNYKHIHIVYNKPENSPYKKRMLRDTGSSYSDDETAYLEYFQKKYNAVLVASNVAADFNYFQNFKNIILSASSFGFWGVANIQHKCTIHIPIHSRCNATCETSDILKWCGHNVYTYSKVEFLNFNEIQQTIEHIFPSCEGYVTQRSYPNKHITLYPVHFCNTSGFLSNCSLALYSYIRYYNLTNSVPDSINMSLLFELYKHDAFTYFNTNKASHLMYNDTSDGSSLCKLIHMDDCICKNCSPLLEDKRWSGRYGNLCYKTYMYGLNVGPCYFNKYEVPLVSELKKCNFKHWSQFHPYSDILIESAKPFALSLFSPSSYILNMVKEIEVKYNIDYDNTCVLFLRGGDKATETKIPTYEDYLTEVQKNHQAENLRYLIQSDESEFIVQMTDTLKQSFYFKDEIRTISRSRKGQVDKCYEANNFEFTMQFLAITIIMSKCKYVYCNTGNCSLWIRLYRTLSSGFYQWIYWNGKPIWYTPSMKEI
jgi:hypothetical protein